MFFEIVIETAFPFLTENTGGICTAVHSYALKKKFCAPEESTVNVTFGYEECNVGKTISAPCYAMCMERQTKKRENSNESLYSHSNHINSIFFTIKTIHIPFEFFKTSIPFQELKRLYY